jgi:hypothetical protein
MGRGGVQVVEPPDAIKSVLVRWNGVKLDLAQLAKLRWIKKLSTPKICSVIGKRRSCVRASIRTIRKCVLSELNLTSEERKLIEIQFSVEDRKFG